jgi:8-amino-7-oxononanoate synthase
LATIKAAYKYLNISSSISTSLNTGPVENSQQKLKKNITFFKTEIQRLGLQNLFIESNSAIHCCVVSGTIKTKKTANQLQEKGYDVKAILSPTVSVGEERLRFCLHAYNSTKEITGVLDNLRIFVK